MVYWVIAKVVAPAAIVRTEPLTIERLGPFESQSLAAKARDAAATRYRNQVETKLEIVCDFS